MTAVAVGIAVWAALAALSPERSAGEQAVVHPAGRQAAGAAGAIAAFAEQASQQVGSVELLRQHGWLRCRGHQAALRAYGGYCWITDTDTVVARLAALAA